MQRIPSLTNYALAALAIITFGLCQASAQAADSRPITLIIPLAPGGTLDFQGRAFAAVAEKYLGKPMVVVNRTGRAGEVGSLAIAKAKPDGYTLGLAWSDQATFIIGNRGQIPNLSPKVVSLDDFIVLGRITNSSPVFLVPTNSPWKTIQQAFEDIKTQPYIQFLIIARGPLCELGTQLLISNDLGYMQVTLNPFLPREGV